MSTYYYRVGIDFGSFKRDVLLFKTLAISQLVYLYLFPPTGAFAWDSVSVAMILSGYTVSIMATNALGKNPARKTPLGKSLLGKSLLGKPC